MDASERTLVIFESVCSGLVECLSLVHSDIKQMTRHGNQLSLKEQEQARSKLMLIIKSNKLVIDDINKQIRLAMQYSRQLESHLLKIEQLKTRYEMHLKMGLVVGKGTAPRPKSTITRTTYTPDSTETEFESHMGSFLFSIEDIQGFARVCQGDIFEISIKYGDLQKFKTRIHVLKGYRQKCDNRQSVFKAHIADRLAIKAYECKGLGRRILLGHKLCETRDLFTARSQLMTISLNQTGSIKLNLIVTWNPLHMAPSNGSAGVDISHISLSNTPIHLE